MMRGVGGRAQTGTIAASQTAEFVNAIDATTAQTWPPPATIVSVRRARNLGARSGWTTLEEASVEARMSSNSAIVSGP
jgi:hypothetical protein